MEKKTINIVTNHKKDYDEFMEDIKYKGLDIDFKFKSKLDSNKDCDLLIFDVDELDDIKLINSNLSIPTITATKKTSCSFILGSYEKGAIDCIKKPLESEIVIDKIERCLFK